jgi:hypothetical protein
MVDIFNLFNAAINIARAVLDPFRTVSSTESEACEEESSGLHFDVGETGLAEAVSACAIGSSAKEVGVCSAAFKYDALFL